MKVTFRKLPESIQTAVVAYAQSSNEDYRRFKFDIDNMTQTSDIEYWLDKKVTIEGPPPDLNLIDAICKAGRINTPVLIDTDRDITIEGRHRLTAAKKCRLPVPIVAIYRK